MGISRESLLLRSLQSGYWVGHQAVTEEKEESQGSFLLHTKRVLIHFILCQARSPCPVKNVVSFLPNVAEFAQTWSCQLLREEECAYPPA